MIKDVIEALKKVILIEERLQSLSGKTEKVAVQVLDMDKRLITRGEIRSDDADGDVARVSFQGCGCHRTASQDSVASSAQQRQRNCLLTKAILRGTTILPTIADRHFRPIRHKAPL